jgi:hypothetical protein
MCEMSVVWTSVKCSFRFLSVASVGIILFGCSTYVVHQKLYVPQDTQKELLYGKTVELEGAEVTVFPVVISENLQALYGPSLTLFAQASGEAVIDNPLTIDLWLTLQRGTMQMNLQNATVALQGNDRSLKPVAIMLEAIQHFPDRKSERSYEQIEGVMSANHRKKPYRFVLVYGVDRARIEPFVFNLGTVELNGQRVSLQPVVFTRNGWNFYR